ncbi:hypothetical protein [Aromatoleum tolulyticum]|uniref:hypothetical protein n=1 Tax=Aromatoleum tolulyticum TaxID=34027 RepID=UPI000970AB1B|nr:hypothetical protein [Aromatoleum tolulyticum]
MVSELHRMGFQRLRIMPYEHPLAWRLAVAPRDGFSLRNGASLKDNAWEGVPIYSSAGGGNCYFDWQDAKSDNARALAEKFLLRFADVAKRGAGRDWQYAGWLSELVGVLEGGDLLPVTMWEYMKDTPDQLEFLPIWSASGENTWNDGSAYITAAPAPNVRRFPLPPAWDDSDEEKIESK